MALPYDLTVIPPPVVIQPVDFEVKLAALKADLGTRFPAVAPLLELEGAPVVMLLEAFAFFIMQNEARINDAARANLLAFANAGDLDQLAVFYDVLRMDGEDDERLRKRVVLAIQGRSTGGPAARYRFVAMSANVRASDVAVYRDGLDPTVHVRVYAADNGGIADEDLLEDIRTALNSPEVRLVNDTIEVASAVFLVVNVVANVILLPETPVSVLASMEAALREAWAAETGLGFDFVRNWGEARMMIPGVYTVEIVTPAADVVAPYERALSIGTVTLNYQGRGY
jgi:phage-related baseplate assembly protein